MAFSFVIAIDFFDFGDKKDRWLYAHGAGQRSNVRYSVVLAVERIIIGRFNLR